MFLTVAVPLGLIAYLLVAYVQRTFEERAIYHNAAAARLAAQTVQELFTGLNRDLETLAAQPEFVRNIELIRAPDVAEPQLRGLIARSRHLDRLFVADKDGVELFAYPLDAGATGKSFADRDWFKGVASSQRTYVSEIYQRETPPQLHVAAIATPIWNNQHEVVGYLVGQLPAASLSVWLAQIKPSPAGMVALVDQRNTLVSAGNGDQQPRRLTDQKLTEQLVEGGERTLRMADPVTGEDGFLSHRSVASMGWSVLARQPSATAFAPVLMLQYIITGLAAVCFVAMFGFGLAWLHSLHSHQQAIVEKNRRLQADLEMAREAQTAIMPVRFPSFPSGVPADQSAIRFCHRYEAAQEIGGDFFDVLALSDTQAGVFICDVLGNGLRAALVEAMVRSYVEELKPIAHDPGRLLTEVNSRLASALGRNSHPAFASAFYVVADTTTGRVRYANAGHPSAFLVRRTSGTVEPLNFDHGTAAPALGLFDDTIYTSHETEMTAHDLLMLYSDGLYEVAGPNGERFGQNRLLEAVRRRVNLPPERMFDDLLAEIRRFSPAQQINDDICLVGIAVERVGESAAVVRAAA